MAHTHVEAFHIMLYADKFDNKEWIWNSRDGVTPYCLTNRQGNEASHINWKGDIYAPNHAPIVGDRIFVTLTKERAREKATKYVARELNRLQEHEYFSKMTQEQVVEWFVGDWTKHGGEPDLIEVTEEMAKEFTQHGVDRHPERRPFGRRFA